MLIRENQPNWSEKYRPQRLEDAVLPAKIKRELITIRENGAGPNLLFHGSYGVGKTTVAHLLTDSRPIFVNCASNGAAELKELEKMLSGSVFGDLSVVLLDEAHHLTKTNQGLLSKLVETRSTGCLFVITTNYLEKIIDPIRSRFEPVSFDFDKGDSGLLQEMQRRAMNILANENITADEESVRKIVHHHFPDMRRVMSKLQMEFSSIGANA